MLYFFSIFSTRMINIINFSLHHKDGLDFKLVCQCNQGNQPQPEKAHLFQDKKSGLHLKIWVSDLSIFKANEGYFLLFHKFRHILL